MAINKQERLYLKVCTVILWFTLILQLVLTIVNRKVSLAEAIVRYFSYFTILTNILVALCFTFLLRSRKSIFHKAGTQTAITVYIVIVSLVYNLVLRAQWGPPSGWARVADELLHSINPLLFVLYWILYTEKRAVHWHSIPAWLLYPLAYLGYTLARGSIVHFYPYPFIDVGQLGYGAALLNCLWVSLAIIFFSLLFVGLAKLMGRRP